MPEIRALAKPEIYLLGTSVSGGKQTTGGTFSGIVDHSKSGTNSILSPTQLNKEDILTFDESVRIIITGQITPKPNYTRRSGPFSSLEFEGRVRYNDLDINHYAETYYTLNGKDPVRTANYLYKYRDRDDFESKEEIAAPYISTEVINVDTRTTLNPSNPSGYDSNPSGDEGYEISTLNPSAPSAGPDNIESLGFILRNVNSGSNLIVLKARTFFQGRVSPVTVAYFKMYTSTIFTTTVNNQDNNE